MVFMVLGTAWWSSDIDYTAAACMGLSPSFGPAWAHGSGLKSSEPKPPPQAKPKPGQNITNLKLYHDIEIELRV
ncbi:uncharacterized protein F5147DRAFT_726899 [Suillus discolor]|uniref:Uncharacterized protein n=1 Tax=Suillus discolor TaxID=1912936 RepID=A0A9P7EU56_9AGAM|nr:uncharacterized protein F5147DRAFT_726899 [Suillus discolor]KAG2088494.1 hypothetical protein F5147DRAFT_726899 [Suillus discolor]